MSGFVGGRADDHAGNTVLGGCEETERVVVFEGALEEGIENPKISATVALGDVLQIDLIVVAVVRHDVDTVIGRPIGDAIAFAAKRFSIRTDDLVTLLPARARFVVGDLGLEATLGAIDREVPALVGDRGVERVVENRPAAVAHHDRHGVVDVDVVGEDAGIAFVVAHGIHLVTKLDAFAFLVLDVEVELALGLVVTIPAARALEFPFALAEKIERAVGIDALRPIADPPVGEIEMVGRFGDEQSARYLHEPVPTAEIRRTVTPVVEIPSQVAGNRLADGSGEHQLANL